MSDCTASKDPFCRLEREPWQTSVQQKSKSNTSGAPLGVLPVLGTLDLDSGEPQLRARGGLAGWQEKRVIEFIEEHLSEPISLSTLAKLVRLSPYHFARAFKLTFGQPPHRYHVSRRLERAKLLLTNFPVTYVALAVGYAETSSFSTAFRKATGCSPSRYGRRSA